MNKQFIKYGIIGFFIILLDQLSKQYILNTFSLNESRAIIPHFFNLTFVRNSGAAWGIFGNSTMLLTVSSVVIIALFCYLFVHYKDKFVRYCLALIISGAIGNLIDRLRFQYVVDFLDFNILGYNFPVFNVADIAVSCGTIMLIIYLFVTSGEKNAIR